MLGIEHSEEQREAANAQAARYGEQVRLLELRGLEEERFYKYLSWIVFWLQFRGTSTLETIHKAYWNAYTSHPFILNLTGDDESLGGQMSKNIAMVPLVSNGKELGKALINEAGEIQIKLHDWTKPEDLKNILAFMSALTNSFIFAPLD
jgi:hypothetical protein